MFKDLQEDIKRAFSEVCENMNPLEWYDENNSRHKSRNRSTKENPNQGKIRNEKLRKLNKNLRGKPCQQMEDMEEGIYLVEHKVEKNR